MISPRAPRDGDRSRTAVLPVCCRAIGAQLTAVRETRQLSVDTIASKLLLSKGQILGLEHADSSAFYNTAFFIRGLRKYMAFLGLPADLLVEEHDEDEEDGLRLMLADSAPTRGLPPAGRARSWAVPGAAAAIALVAGTTLFVNRIGWWPAPDLASDLVSLSVNAPLPAQPIAVGTEAQQTVRAEPALAVGAGADPDSAVRVSVGKATWIFIRYPDNRVIERRLAAGEQLDIGPLPVYLAVGTADSVQVSVENRPVALGPYIRNGQVRLTQPDLAKLVP